MITREEFQVHAASGQYDGDTLLVVACENRLPVRVTTRDGVPFAGYVQEFSENGWVHLSRSLADSVLHFRPVRRNDIEKVEAL